MVNDKEKFLFIHIPRTGGMSMRAALETIPNTQHTGHRSLFKNKVIGRRSGNGIRKRNKRINYFKFTFVRHPLDRLVSCWHRHTQINTMFNETGKAIDSFDYFLDLLAAGEYNNKYRYTVVPMVNWLKDNDGNISMDFIGRFENLTDDWKTISARIGCEVEFPKKNSTRHRRWMRYYTPERRRMMEEYYKEDMERFSY